MNIVTPPHLLVEVVGVIGVVIGLRTSVLLGREGGAEATGNERTYGRCAPGDRRDARADGRGIYDARFEEVPPLNMVLRSQHSFEQRLQSHLHPKGALETGGVHDRDHGGDSGGATGIPQRNGADL